MTFDLSETGISEKKNNILRPKERKTYTDTIKNSFLLKAETYLKLSVKKILLDIYFSQTVTFDRSQTSITENEWIQVNVMPKENKTSLKRLEILFK